jgi:hypothetical protein
MIFRKSSVHANHGTDDIDSVTQIVKLIRLSYKPVPIILAADSVFSIKKPLIISRKASK